MKRVIESLNEMSFLLPNGWHICEDVYSLPNGQGMINKENYVSEKGEVISLFEVHRDPDEFFKYYDNLVGNYQILTQKYQLVLKGNIKVGEFIFPTYVIKCFEDKPFYTLQAFCNCGDCLACFMLILESFTGTIKDATAKNNVLKELIKILRTIE